MFDVSIHRVHRVVRRPRSGTDTFWTTLSFIGKDDVSLGEITVFHASGVESLDYDWENGEENSDATGRTKDD